MIRTYSPGMSEEYDKLTKNNMRGSVANMFNELPESELTPDEVEDLSDEKNREDAEQGMEDEDMPDGPLVDNED